MGFARLGLHRTRRAGLRLLLVVGLAAVVLFAAYRGHLLVRRENPALRSQTPWRLAATEPGPFPPRGLSALFSLPAPTTVPMIAWLVIGLGGASRILHRGGAAAARSAWVHGGLWAVTGLFASLRPVVGESGTVVAWPLALLARWVPVYEIIRSPERLGIAALMGLAVLAGLGFAELAGRMRLVARWGGRAAYASLAVVAAAMYFALPPAPVLYGLPAIDRPYPLTQALTVDPPLRAALGNGQGPLVELPAAAYPWAQAAAMYRSIFHRRPLLNGYSSYWPAGFPERIALADRLPDLDALAELRRTTDLAMVLVHTASLGQEQRQRWLDLAAHGPQPEFRLVARAESDLLFVVDHPSAPRP